MRTSKQRRGKKKKKKYGADQQVSVVALFFSSLCENGECFQVAFDSLVQLFLALERGSAAMLVVHDESRCQECGRWIGEMERSVDNASKETALGNDAAKPVVALPVRDKILLGAEHLVGIERVGDISNSTWPTVRKSKSGGIRNERQLIVAAASNCCDTGLNLGTRVGNENFDKNTGTMRIRLVELQTKVAHDQRVSLCKEKE